MSDLFNSMLDSFQSSEEIIKIAREAGEQAADNAIRKEAGEQTPPVKTENGDESLQDKIAAQLEKNASLTSRDALAAAKEVTPGVSDSTPPEDVVKLAELVANNTEPGTLGLSDAYDSVDFDKLAAEEITMEKIAGAALPALGGLGLGLLAGGGGMALHARNKREDLTDQFKGYVQADALRDRKNLYKAYHMGRAAALQASTGGSE